MRGLLLAVGVLVLLEACAASSIRRSPISEEDLLSGKALDPTFAVSAPVISIDDAFALDGNLCVRLIGAGQLYLYDLDGATRCLLGLLHSTARAASLAIVYTPTPERRRGHARMGIARLNAWLAEHGVAKRYFHFDPSNRAAQGLAQKIGGELVQAGVDIDFR